MNLIECLKKNGMYIPNYNEASIVDLMKIIYSYCGYSENIKNNNINIKKYVKNQKHILFILVDGMGSNLVDSLPDSMILKQKRVKDLQTVCPTTTGCVLTSIATAKTPAIHGMIGWYNYNRDKKIDYSPLLFKERKTGKDLKEFGIKEKNIYLYDSVMNKLNRKTTALLPDSIVNSTFSQFMLNKNRIGYENLEDAFQKVTNNIKENINISTFTYLYLPHVDKLSHYNGVNSSEVKVFLESLEYEIRRLKEDNIENLEIIITADHGQIDVNQEITMDFNKYANYFYALPGIDFGTATYYIKKDKEEKFLKEFKKDYKDEMYIFRTEEYIKNGILGSKEISKYMESNLGEFISFCKKGAYFVNTIENENDYIGKIRGSHSGFSKEEIMIPLIIIN